MVERKRKSGLALFDLDQTLIAWDTQLLFCNWVLRKEPVRRLYLLIFLPFLVFSRVLGAEGMKRIFLSFLWRMPRSRLCLLYTSPSPRDRTRSRMPSSA